MVKVRLLPGAIMAGPHRHHFHGEVVEVSANDAKRLSAERLVEIVSEDEAAAAAAAEAAPESGMLAGAPEAAVMPSAKVKVKAGVKL